MLAREQDGGEADPVSPQLSPHLGPILGRDDEMPALRDQCADFLGHPTAQFGIAGAERDDHGFRIFPKQSKDPSLDPLLQSADLATRSTAQPASGVSAAASVKGRYPYRSITHPKAGETMACTAP
jgi:hypothetical protein